MHGYSYITMVQSSLNAWNEEEIRKYVFSFLTHVLGRPTRDTMKFYSLRFEHFLDCVDGT